MAGMWCDMDWRENAGLTRRTWDVRKEQASSIAALADGLGVAHSDLVRVLLAHALNDVKAGRLSLVAEPLRCRLTNEVD